jgi:PBSX family phage terminase large subunit
MDIRLLPKQEQYICDVTSHIIGYIGGFGSGKTYATCLKAILLSASNPATAGMLVSPTYQMMRDTTRRAFIDILDRNNISYLFRASENRIIIQENQSEVWFRSADDPDKLKGANLSFVGADEAAMMTREAFEIMLSRVRDSNANIRQTFLASTPDGFNWLYDLFVNGDTNRRLINTSTTENIYLPQEYVNTLRENYDSELIKQYIDGEFVNVNKAQVYYAFNRSKNVIERSYDPSLPIYVCIDFNVNPMCWAVIQHYQGIDYVIDEIIGINTNTEDQTRTLLNKYPNALAITIYGDYSGNQRHTSSRTTDYEIIRSIIPSAEIRVKPNPPVNERINAVNARLRNSQGDIRLFIDNRCKRLISDFERVSYKTGSRDLDKSNTELTHISDAIGYYIEMNYSIKGKIKVQHLF